MDNSKPQLEIILASPRGFCAGVERAVDTVEKAIEKFGAPIYVRHEIVHNKRVIQDLKDKGAIFVKELDEVPTGAITIFSAHGVSQKVVEDAKVRQLPVIDATCPLVTKVHNEGKNYAKKGFEIILIGHEGHPEVIGTKGRIDGNVYVVSDPQDVENLCISNDKKLAYITQTTLSVDDTREVITALREKYPHIQGSEVNDICYATQNRQQAVRDLAKHVDLIFVLGAKNSSNSNRLREIGEELGCPSYLIDDYTHIDPSWLQDDMQKIGITAGASAPEILINEVLDYLKKSRSITVKKLETIEENIHFNLPAELKRLSA